MSVRDYIKDKAIPIFIAILTCFLVLSFMIIMGVYLPLAIMVEIIYAAGLCAIGIYDCLRRKPYYDRLKETRDTLEEKTYLAEIIDKPDFYEGKIMYDIVRENGKYMNDVIANQQLEILEYKRYVELWAHEIKTPIAVARLTIENNRDQVTTDIEEELRRVEEYVEQMLYYAKSSSLEEDYHIQQVSLRKIIVECLQKNAKMMVGKKVTPKLENLDFQILTDPKWTEFMVNQVLSNAVKYVSRDRSPQIRISADENCGKIRLQLSDNGVGIPQSDIASVFKKGFTGENGRIFKKSTGMGLYLCKTMCDKMDIEIGIRSEKDRGTQVCFSFSKP